MTNNGFVHSESADHKHLFVGDRVIFGENIGFFSPSKNVEQLAETMHDGWFNSPVHFNNMVGEGFNEVGIAAVELNDGWYFMQFFMG